MTNDELLKLRKFQTPKFFNFQITKYKYQTNYNDQNSKYKPVLIIEKLRFICNLVLGTWNLKNLVFGHLPTLG